MYISYLLKKKKASGHVVVEASDKNQDSDILAAYNAILCNGIDGLTSLEVRERLTCLSFVTKNNHDPETQLADIGAHFTNVKERMTDKLLYNGQTDFDKQVAKIYEEKAITLLDGGGVQVKGIRRLA